MNWNALFDSQPCNDLSSNIDDLSEHPKLLPLEDHRLIIVEGIDAAKFLQGQCSCDFLKLEHSQSLLGTHCTPKGRMISTFVAAELAQEGDSANETRAIGLRVHASIADLALAALQKYAVFSKVKLRLSQDHFLFAFLGDRSLLSEPPQPSHYAVNAGFTMLASADNQTEFWSLKDHLPELIAALPQASPQSDSRLWRLKNIRRGIAEIDANLSEKLLPQEINYQLVEGISFNKGCYTGQEIIARLHYRGQLKKHMRRGIVNCAFTPQNGEAIFVAEKNVGALINTVQIGETSFEFLALCDDAVFESSGNLTADSNTENSPYLRQDSPSILQWLSLPYAIS